MRKALSIGITGTILGIAPVLTGTHMYTAPNGICVGSANVSAYVLTADREFDLTYGSPDSERTIITVNW